MSAQSASRRLHSLPPHHARGTFARNAFGTVRPVVLLLGRLLPLASAAPLGIWERKRLHTLGGDDDLPESPDDPSLWIYLAIAVALVLLGGVFAGLTIALMGQDETYLQVIAESADGSERQHAKRVLNLLGKGKHWVLVTLLLSNVITNETLPIVLDRSLGGGWPAVVSSTVLIVIFGEVAPQSVCVRYGLSIGAFMAPFVVLLMWILCPIAWPTAKLLDWLLGEDHGIMYKKAGLKQLVTLHKTLGAGAGEQLMEDEVTIINSVLDLKDKPVGDIMTPMQDVFTMSADTVLDERMMDTILSQGYSRIPIYAPENSRNFIGMLLVKILITYDPEDCKRVRDFALATLPETAPHTSCLDIINFFQEGKSHMVLVSDYPGQDKGALGVVTLEDVIEELIGEEIIDESDVFVDVHKAIRRMAPSPRTRFTGKQFTDDHVVDSDDEHKEPTETQPLLAKRPSQSEGRKSSVTNGQTTFLMRRKSSAASEATRETGNRGTVPVRSSATDMKEHLKHLGPSNAASHPRQTKYTSVKIKPGVGTIPEDKATTKGTEPDSKVMSSAIVADVHGDATTTNADSDGAYGTMASPTIHPWRSSNPPGTQQLSAQEASEIAKENASRPGTAEGFRPEESEEPTQMPLPEKIVFGAAAVPPEDDTVGEMAGSSVNTNRSKKRMAARSGSITETTIESNDGFKKVVLETTSSSEEADGDGVSPGTEREPQRNSFFGFGRRKSDGSDKTISAENSNQSGQDGAGSKDAVNGADGNAEVAKKRRKKRGKKKKGGD